MSVTELRDLIARMPISNPTLDDLKTAWPYLPNATLQNFINPTSDEVMGGRQYDHIICHVPPTRIRGACVPAVYSRALQVLDGMHPFSNPSVMEPLQSGEILTSQYRPMAAEYADKTWPDELIAIGADNDYVQFVMVDDVVHLEDGYNSVAEAYSIHALLRTPYSKFIANRAKPPITVIPLSVAFNDTLAETTDNPMLGCEYLIGITEFKHKDWEKRLGFHRVPILYICAVCGGPISEADCLYCGRRFSATREVTMWRYPWDGNYVWQAPLPTMLDELHCDVDHRRFSMAASERVEREYGDAALPLVDAIKTAMNTARTNLIGGHHDPIMVQILNRLVPEAGIGAEGDITEVFNRNPRTRHVELKMR